MAIRLDAPTSHDNAASHGDKWMSVGSTVLVHGVTEKPEAGTIIGPMDVDGRLPVVVISPEPLLLTLVNISPVTAEGRERAAGKHSQSDDSGDSSCSSDSSDSSDRGTDADEIDGADDTEGMICPVVKVPAGADLFACLGEALAPCAPIFCTYAAMLPVQHRWWTCGYDNLSSVLQSANSLLRAAGPNRLRAAIKGVLDGLGGDGQRPKALELVAAQGFDDAKRRAEAKRVAARGRRDEPAAAERTRALQRLVERAWAEGFDPPSASARGARGLDGTRGAAAFIGAAEV